MNIGIDLGSTYSTVSKYNPSTGPVAMTMKQGDPASIPSEVAFNDLMGQYTCGTSAKGMAGQRGVRLFRAFKMLLVESNKNILAEHGYTGNNTPRAITTKFLGHTLKGLASHEQELSPNQSQIEKFENIVICMPELWANELASQDGRGILRDILLKDIPSQYNIEVGNVRVVTEPEAASAFIAHSYEAENGHPFNGHLLLIDYGGGTLDLTLTQVKSDGKGSMEITYRNSGGAGQNHLDENGICKIGRAGIAFIQNVLQRAMVDAGILAPDQAPDYNSAAFKVSFNRLEADLKDGQKMQEIENIFSQYNSYRNFKKVLTDKWVTSPFTAFYYGETDTVLRITYPHLFLAYQEVVESALRDEINKINESVKTIVGKDPCHPDAGVHDDFKIALVGGFSSFYLVKQQIAELYKLNPNPNLDRRTNGISASTKELAISMGAALLAARKVILQQTARQSIGLASDLAEVNGQEQYQKLFYGITFHQLIVPNKIYYIRKDYDEKKMDDPGNWVLYAGLRDNLTSFVTESSHLRTAGYLMPLKPEMVKRLRQLPDNGVWYVGFSMDENSVIYLHVTPVVIPDTPTPPTPKPIVLDSFNNLFALSAVRRVNIK